MDKSSEMRKILNQYNNAIDNLDKNNQVMESPYNLLKKLGHGIAKKVTFGGTREKIIGAQETAEEAQRIYNQWMKYQGQTKVRRTVPEIKKFLLSHFDKSDIDEAFKKVGVVPVALKLEPNNPKAMKLPELDPTVFDKAIITLMRINAQKNTKIDTKFPRTSETKPKAAPRKSAAAARVDSRRAAVRPTGSSARTPEDARTAIMNVIGVNDKDLFKNKDIDTALDNLLDILKKKNGS